MIVAIDSWVSCPFNTILCEVTALENNVEDRTLVQTRVEAISQFFLPCASREATLTSWTTKTLCST